MPTARMAQVAKVVPSSPLLAMLGSARRVRLPLRGEIGRAESALLRERALDLAESGWCQLTLDLQRVTHWDYRYLPELHRLSQQLQELGGELRLLSPSRYLATILRFGGLEELLDVGEGRGSGRSREEGVGA